MVELRLYNTMSGEKEVFMPQQADQISMYVCGPTVYNYAHIGNARPVVVFDCLYRVLKARYSHVRYARNITDIDDKIIHAAQERGVDIGAVSEEFTEKYREDMAALNALAPTIEPKATEHIGEMVSLTKRLIESGHAYESNGHVLFAVESMQSYGALSGRKLKDMLAGARVEVADYKRHAGDFVLWKPSTDSEPGWNSPWGRGRPGWHLECSAMIKAHLGDSIDIHGGGRDLIFPHHENERAQSCCAYGGDFVRHWMHNAYVDMDGEKMSKSLGNTRTVRELLGQYPGEVLRCALISAQYRSPLNFSEALLEQARSTLDSWYGVLRRYGNRQDVPTPSTETAVYRALMDDLNTPEAFAAMHAAAATLNKSTDAAEIDRARAELLGGGELLGFLASDPDIWFQQDLNAEGLFVEEIEAQIAARAAAKANKDYQLADAIRAALEADGVLLEDGAAGTTWRRGS